jgi:hypothetical protein
MTVTIHRNPDCNASKIVFHIVPEAQTGAFRNEHGESLRDVKAGGFADV